MAVCAVVLIWAATQVLGHLLRILVLVLLATVVANAVEPAISFVQRVVPRVVAALSLYGLVVGSTGA